jgi:hypothetical protein
LDKLICIGFVNKIDGVTYTTTLKWKQNADSLNNIIKWESKEVASD